MVPEAINGPADLPKATAIEEFKGYRQGEPNEILPNRLKETIMKYLRKRGANVQIVVLEMSQAFKADVEQAMATPVIVVDSLHFVRCMNWDLDRVKIRNQNNQEEWIRTSKFQAIQGSNPPPSSI